MYWVRQSQYTKEIEAIDQKIKKQKDAKDAIFRDYKVKKMGVAYVPVADQIKYEDKSFIVDYAGNAPQSKITLQMSRQNELLSNTINQLDSLSKEVPVVESSDEAETVSTSQYSQSITKVSQGDYVGKVDKSMRTIAYCMNDLESTSVELPLVQEGSQYLGYLQEHSTKEIPAESPVINVFDQDRYASSISRFKDLNKLKESLSSETEQFEDVLKSLINSIALSSQTLASVKMASTDKLINSSNSLLYKILKSPYNHYSPVLEAEEIQRIRDEKFDYAESIQGYDPFTLRESSRVRYNLYDKTWKAEDGSEVSTPFGMHQIYEEIIAPVVQNLMEENRIERLKIYNNIHDQKVSYENKWHQDVDAFYRSTHTEGDNIIRDMQKTLSEYIEAYTTLAQYQKTENSMKVGNDLENAVVEESDNSSLVVSAFERQAKEFEQVQEDFSSYMNSLQEDISKRASEFLYVEYYDGRLRDGYSNRLAVATDEASQIDERRKPLLAANALLAKESQLLPEPSVEPAVENDMSINLPQMAKTALSGLDSKEAN